MSHFTDFLGRPLTEDDEIVFSIGSGYGSPAMKRAKVINLIELVAHPNGRVRCYAREDQLKQREPTVFSGKELDDPEKRYVVQVERMKYTHWRNDEGEWEHGERPVKFSVPTRDVVVI